MKILLLMPCDEQHVHAATSIYSNLSDYAQEHTFVMPMFMEYLIQTNAAANWSEAFFKTMLSTQKIYLAAQEEEDDLIIIGNLNNNFTFDVVFNFQEIEESLPYEDNFIQKLREVCETEPTLLKYINKLHIADESKLALRDCGATADFLSRYLVSSADFEKAKKHFEEVFPDGRNPQKSYWS